MQRPSRRTLVTLGAIGIMTAGLEAVLGVTRRTRTADHDRFQNESLSLPSPQEESDTAVEKAIANRRSRREYGTQPLTRRELSQLLWAGQGVTDRSTGYRAAPSAGALYPLTLYVVVGTPGVENLEQGVYQYQPEEHELRQVKSGNVQSRLRQAALDQGDVEDAAIDIVVSATDERTTQKYGNRGKLRYVPMEAGHVGENIYLQAESLTLSTVTIGAFDDERVRQIVDAPANQRPLYVIPVGTRP